jgi:hypothetical protein
MNHLPIRRDQKNQAKADQSPAPGSQYGSRVLSRPGPAARRNQSIRRAAIHQAVGNPVLGLSPQSPGEKTHAKPPSKLFSRINRIDIREG